jgi:hypothetical protein
LYVEDEAAKIMLEELLAYRAKDIFPRCSVIPYGASNVGKSLGLMLTTKKFPRPTCVFLDGDSSQSDGCIMLPGNDAPEIVVFSALRARAWGNLWARLGRDTSSTEDACTGAMTLSDHHEWVRYAANQLRCGTAVLWQSMCAEWVRSIDDSDSKPIVDAIVDALPN